MLAGSEGDVYRGACQMAARGCSSVCGSCWYVFDFIHLLTIGVGCPHTFGHILYIQQSAGVCKEGIVETGRSRSWNEPLPGPV